jgi:diaminopimelate epimerase
MKFVKYQALGNDYLVIEPAAIQGYVLSSERVRQVCHRHYGIGADGILFGPLETSEADFGLRIFNPDGSEAEKSGNGLRIFARYLWDTGRAQDRPFTIQTPGGVVRARVHSGGQRVTVDMGRVSFDSGDIPVAGHRREALDETLLIEGQELRYCAATIGNPHCVVLCEVVSAEEAQRLGTLIERQERFPNRTNVQFLQILDRQNIRIEIWERGAGYTLASGSSSCAAAATAHRLGLCDAHITVHMPGGQIEVRLEPDFTVQMTGPVDRVFTGESDV